MEFFRWNPQDTLIVKAPKRSPLALRMVVLLFALACGVYICLICLRQTSFNNKIRFLNVRVIEQPCPASGMKNLEIPNVHFPKPKTFSREECACNPVRFFAILSMQRSGSGWFETLLNSHMNVSSNGEILGAKERRSNVSAIIDTLDKVYNLDFFTSASKNECSAAVGFKWMLNQAQILANYKPKVNATLLIHNLKEAEKTIAKALEYFKSTRQIVLYYEDIVSNRTKLVDVQEFLRLPYRELTSSQVKIHSGPLSKQIENWGDIQKAIKGTSYESFLNQDYQL
ncbi:hypothetical protein RHSIM_Rhsim07G0230900 [Rhododendron simsii]|uniref:Sulfotransferase n=1 Tax=Rhododendron simsii TaxID=118357 RepID=A0A834LJ73_RHOSS|nr:hypothetical protein RHSIM_Rhsim07G0230900 [Rhododendron simsii]